MSSIMRQRSAVIRAIDGLPRLKLRELQSCQAIGLLAKRLILFAYCGAV
jgi:hypothetical protein